MKHLLLTLFFYTHAIAAYITYNGIAYYQEKTFFGMKERTYTMSIYFEGDKTFLVLHDYKCRAELLLQNQNSNVYTYSEKHVSGPCEVDTEASTQIRITEDKIDYLWQSGNKMISASLQKEV